MQSARQRYWQGASQSGPGDGTRIRIAVADRAHPRLELRSSVARTEVAQYHTRGGLLTVGRNGVNVLFSARTDAAVGDSGGT